MAITFKVLFVDRKGFTLVQDMVFDHDCPPPIYYIRAMKKFTARMLQESAEVGIGERTYDTIAFMRQGGSKSDAFVIYKEEP